MAFWEIKIGNGAWQSADSLGVSVASCNFVSGAPDTLTLNIDQQYDDEPLIQHLEQVELRRDGVRHFLGNSTTIPREGGVVGESIQYIISGPWDWLDNLPLLRTYTGIAQQQNQNPAPGDQPVTQDSDTGTAYLFSDSTGDRIDSASALRSVLEYAIANGAPLRIGGLPPAGLVPWDTLVADSTVSQVISTILRWHPDIDPWIDYSTPIPTIHFTPSGSLGSLTVDASGIQDVSSVSITKRSDLRPKSFCIHYEISQTFNGENWKSYIDDFAGSGQCSDRGAVNVTIPIVGANTQTQVQSVRTSGIPDNGGLLTANGPSGRLWWTRKNPALSHPVLRNSQAFLISTDRIVFGEETQEADPVNPSNGEARLIRQPNSVQDYPRELLDGQIEEWMDRSARRLDIHARIYLDKDAIGFDNLAVQTQEELDAIFGLVAEDGTTINASGSSVDVSGWSYSQGVAQAMGTDAITRNYTRVTSFEEGEAIPQGLAARMFSALNRDTYEGAISLSSREAGATRFHGNRLNISGAKSSWQNMSARVQIVNENYATGESNITFGPPRHLSVQDLVEKMRLGKVVSRSNSTNRSQPNLDINNTSLGGYIAPINNFVALGGGGGGGSAPASHPWRVTLSQDTSNGRYDANITLGKVYDGVLSIDELADIDDDLSELERVSAGDLIFLEYDYADMSNVTLSIKVSELSEYEPFDLNPDPDIDFDIRSRYPLAIVRSSASDSQLLIIEQLARNNLAAIVMIKSGDPIRTFTTV